MGDLTPTGKVYRRRILHQTPQVCRSTEHDNVLVIDSGGGKQATVTARSCRILSETGLPPVEIQGYGSTGPSRTCRIVNVIIKAHVAHKDRPVLFILNRVCLLDDPNENESLAVPFNFWAHGVKCCMRPPEYGGSCGIHVENEFFPFQWDKEKVYFNIEKPNEDDLLNLEWFELTSPHPDLADRVRRKRSTTQVTDIPISEWRKRLGMLPAAVVNKTLEGTTHFYLSPEMESRQDPRREILSHRPGLRWKRRNEVVGTDTFFPSVKSAQGHTCSQMFVGQQSLRWDVYPLKTEAHNYQALQDIARNEGVPNVVRSDNAQSETDTEWSDFCRKQCISQQTTIPHSPWMNFTERHIGSLGGMVRNCHRAFKIPYKYHNWTQRWCCDVHNVAANRRLNWRCPDEIHHGYTQDISPFRFHMWEPIWYMEKREKAPQDSWKPGRWMGFAHQCGDKFTYWIRTEKDGKGKDVFLKRRTVKTRRKNIGRPTEYVNNNLLEAEFILMDQDRNRLEYDVDSFNIESGESNASADEDMELQPPSGEIPASNSGDLQGVEAIRMDYPGVQPTSENEVHQNLEGDTMAPANGVHQPTIDDNTTSNIGVHQSTVDDGDEMDPADDSIMASESEVQQPTADDDHASADDDSQNDMEDIATSYPHETPIVDETEDEDLTDIYNQFQIEDEVDDEFDKIVDHKFENGILIFTARFQGSSNGEHLVEVPFSILKKDVPLECAKYIRNYVLDSTSRRSGTYTTWATTMLKQHTRAVRRLHRAYGTGISMRYSRNRRAKINSTASTLAYQAIHGSTPQKKAKKVRPIEKQGITIPRSIRQAMLQDLASVGTPQEGKWGAAITKEMDGLERLRVFEYHDPVSTRFNRSEGWQFAPMHMVFDIKADGRYKARLCVGGNVLDCDDYTTFSSTIKDISIRLLMVIAAQNKLHTMTTDVANAFCTAPCMEKIWSTAGKEFGKRQGSKVSLKRALYGTKTASRSFHEFLGALMLRMGFQPSRADQDLWWRKSDDYDGYDYLATHVDDVICVAMNPSQYISQIEQEFKLRDTTDEPSYYLGNDLKKMKNGRLHISSTTYTKEVVRKYQADFEPVRKHNIPMDPKCHPELDTSPLLDEDGTKHFQRIIGVCQWLIVSGRFDLCYSITSLSRFSAGPREGHLEMARQIMGYLRKYPKRGYVVNPEPPHFDSVYSDVEVKCDFGNQYSYFREELDPRFPDPILKELDLNIFIDADHAHDKISGRSITGLLAMLGSTPITWRSKRQTSVQTSTFGAEFTALKAGVEEAITIRYHLRSMGVKVSKSTPIWVDNMSVVLNATNPGSSLNKKAIALSYHFVREHQAQKVISIRKVDTKDNFADPFTKALSNPEFHGFFRHLQCN